MIPAVALNSSNFESTKQLDEAKAEAGRTKNHTAKLRNEDNIYKEVVVRARDLCERYKCLWTNLQTEDEDRLKTEALADSKDIFNEISTKTIKYREKLAVDEKQLSEQKISMQLWRAVPRALPA